MTLINFCFVFLSTSGVKLSYTEDTTYLRICRGNLPRELAVGIGRRNLPWLFTVVICYGFFVYVNKFFFVYVNKSCLFGSKPFLYVSKTFLFVRFF